MTGENGPKYFAVTKRSNARAAIQWGFGLKFPLVLYIVWVNSEGSGKTPQMHRLAWAFAVWLCDNYPFHLGWLKLILFCILQNTVPNLPTNVETLKSADN